MRDRVLFTFAILMTVTHVLFSQLPDSGITWLDPGKEPFQLTGFEWFSEDQVYRRLPVHPQWEIREAVDNLANHTAGGQIRFSSDCSSIWIRVELKEKSGMYHMPATGQSGFDLYVNEGREQRYFRTTRFNADSISYEAELFASDKKEMRSFTLNFPLYNGVHSVLVGVDKGAVVEAPPAFKQAGKIVVYGTSITQGGCVGRPGMAYTNILSRKLDMQFVNLGFSGNGRGEPALARLIAEISDTRCIILDYEANAGMNMKETLGPFVDILREIHPDVPILLVSKIRYANTAEGSSRYNDWIHLKNFQEELVHERRNAGDDHIYFLDGSTILGEDYDECTVDGVHPNDLGSYRIAFAWLPVIEQILSRKQNQEDLPE